MHSEVGSRWVKGLQRKEQKKLRDMVFTLGTLFEAGLLLINAVAILNEEKFLKKGEGPPLLYLFPIDAHPTPHPTPNPPKPPSPHSWLGT